MDPLQEVYNKSRSMDKDAYREALDRPVKAVTESAPYKIIDFALNGEDADISLAESLIPTFSLQAKLKQGKMPGLADLLDIPNPLKAMGPIAFTLKELRSGARMGKTLRNIEKAKDARKYVTAYHKTPNKNVANIDKEGLKLQHPDYGANTSDTDAYSPMIWLSGHPTFIPVLRRYGDGLDETTTYKVKIPRKEFYDTPRMMMPQGRSGPKVMAAKGEPSWSKEAHKYVINTYGKDIPPEYLEKMDNADRLASISKTERQGNLRSFVADLVESGKIPSYIPKKYGVPASGDFIGYNRGQRPISNSQLGNIVQDEMRTNFPPVKERLGYGLAEAASGASKKLKNESIPKYPASPYNTLKGFMDVPFKDKKPPFKSRLELEMSPLVVESKPKFEPGAISRGVDDTEDMTEIKIPPKDRMFNWTLYNTRRQALDDTPLKAAYAALPKVVYKNGDPIDRYPYYRVTLSEGAVSRGDKPDWPNLEKAKLDPRGYLENFSQPNKSKALEKIFSSPSLSDLSEELSQERFRTTTGSIKRGDGLYHYGDRKPRRLSELIDARPADDPFAETTPLEELYKGFVDKYTAGAEPSSAHSEWAQQYAGQKLREIMRKRVNAGLD